MNAATIQSFQDMLVNLDATQLAGIKDQVFACYRTNLVQHIQWLEPDELLLAGSFIFANTNTQQAPNVTIAAEAIEELEPYCEDTLFDNTGSQKPQQPLNCCDGCYHYALDQQSHMGLHGCLSDSE